MKFKNFVKPDSFGYNDTARFLKKDNSRSYYFHRVKQIWTAGRKHSKMRGGVGDKSQDTIDVVKTFSHLCLIWPERKCQKLVKDIVLAKRNENFCRDRAPSLQLRLDREDSSLNLLTEQEKLCYVKAWMSAFCKTLPALPPFPLSLITCGKRAYYPHRTTRVD